MRPEPDMDNMRARIPLYAAGFGASAMGLAALSTTIVDAGFKALIFLLLGLGFCASWAVRSRIISRSLMETTALAVLVLTFAATVIIPSFRYGLFPREAMKAADLCLAVILGWLMVTYSFSLLTDRAVTFLCVPSLSLLGLVTTLGPTIEMLVYFALFLALACFALVQQNALSYSEGKKSALRFHAGSVDLHVRMTAGVTLAALSVGVIFGVLFSPALSEALSFRLSVRKDPLHIDQYVEADFVPVATGPITLSEREVMQVKCQEGYLWRGQTFNKYNGQGWSNSMDQDVQIIYSEDPAAKGKRGASVFDIRKDAGPNKRAAVRAVKQKFYIVGGQYRTVFAAAEPQTVRFKKPQSFLRLGGGLQTHTICRRGDAYEVVSLVSKARPRQLREASEDYPVYILDRYTSTPESCWRASKLAQRITANESNPYDRAMAIQSYLENNYAYDAHAPAAPRDEDAVTFFLFKSRRGYCDIFASAMVVMCRSSGIPARWVIGFAPGQFTEPDRRYHIRLKDHHAWAELYFPGYGWVPFDPAPSPDNTGFIDRLITRWSGIKDVLVYEAPTLLIVGVLTLLIVHLLKSEVIDRRRAAKGGPRQGRAGSALAQVIENYRRMCDVLRGFGYPRHPAATPLEYSAEMSALFSPQLGLVTSTVDSLTSDFVQVRYASRELPPEAALLGDSRLSGLQSELRTARRRKTLP